jgi:hypothetical protein
MFFGHYNVVKTSTAAGLRSQGTGPTISTCQDPQDTAAYWAPESFLQTTPSGPAKVFLPGCKGTGPGGGPPYTCGTDPNNTIYVRAYYLTTSGANTGELPPGLMMVVGTPDATSAPTAINHVYWDCGATTTKKGIQVQTPESIWPYTCSPFPFPNNEGVTEIIDFPSCWNGQSSFPSHGAGQVPGYIDPAVSATLSASNDLAYPPASGGCSALSPAGTYHPVPHVSMRIHYTGLGLSGGPSISNDSQTIDPSSCPSPADQNVPSFPWTCTTQAQPTDIALQLSSTQPGGANPQPGPWYTEHADYLQSWQQGVSPPGTGDPHTGTLNSLTHYCLQEAITCGFIPSSTKGSAYPPFPGT